MNSWVNGHHFFKNTPEGIPHLSKIIRKPEGIGVEYKDVADALTGIMLFIEIQMEKKLWKRRNTVISIPSQWL